MRVVTVDGLTSDMILGRDFLKQNSCMIDVGKDILHLQDRDVILPFRKKYDKGAARRQVRGTDLGEK